MFSDASLTRVCTVAFAVINQRNILNQSLIIRKSRLARKKLSITRLELVAAHMSILAENVKTCLNKLSVRKICGSVLNWLKDNGNTKHLLVIGCLKSKEKVLSNGYIFLRKKIQSILGVEVVKYVSLIISGGKIPNTFRANDLNNQKLKLRGI